MSIILKQPITGPAAWRGSDLAGDDLLRHALGDEAIAAIYEVLAEHKARPAGSHVQMPTTADEAQAMVKLGLVWLAEHAPDRLKPQLPPLTERQRKVAYFALMRFASAARERAAAAAQIGSPTPPGTTERFMQDAKDAEELQMILRADPPAAVQGGAT